MSQEFISGSQISLHFLRMLVQSLKEILFVSFIVLLIAISLYLYIKGDHYVLNVILLIKYLFANLLTIFKSTNLITFPDVNGQILKAPADKYCNWYSHVILPQLLSTLHLAFISGLKWFFSCFGVIFMFFYYKGKQQAKNQYIRGIKLITPFKLKRQIFFHNIKHLNFSPYKIANFPYPENSQYHHTLITGAPGTGKTLINSDMIDQVRKKHHRALIYDRTGTYVRKFYNPQKDIILNPFDQRGSNWDIFHEAKSMSDFDLIAASLIEQPANSTDPIWTNAARIVLSESCFLISKEEKPSIKKLCEILLKMPLRDFAKYIKSTNAGSIIDAAADKNANGGALSVRMVLSTYANCLKFIDNDLSDDFFSIRNWIQDNNSEGFLFLSSSATKYDSIKSLLSLWVDLAVRELLNLNQEEKRTIWLFLDELPSLQSLPSLKMAFAESRQYGAAIVASMQLISQLEEVYGVLGAKVISGNCRNRLILASPDEGTASWCAKNLGKNETIISKKNVSFGANTIRDGVSVSDSKEIETLVIPSEIMNLKNLEFYVKFSNGFDVSKSKIKYQKRTDVAEKFIQKAERPEEHHQNQQQIQVPINDLKQSIITEFQKQLSENGLEIEEVKEIEDDLEVIEDREEDDNEGFTDKNKFHNNQNPANSYDDFY